MRFHVLAVPHTVTCKEYSACAFTQKVLKFCAMMMPRGHTIYHYGHERSVVECTEHVSVMNDAVLQKTYGSYDWKKEQFKSLNGDFASIHFNTSASIQVGLRKKPGDFLLLFWGSGHAKVAEDHKDLFCVEPGIGCFNNLTVPFSVFESYAVMHYIYGKYNIAPKFYDAVVPNYFDTNDFLPRIKTQEDFDGLTNTMPRFKGLRRGYAILIARLITSKGIGIAVDVCRNTGIKLLIAGQGHLKDILDTKTLTDDSIVTPLHCLTGITHIGYIEPEERKVLLAGAKCLMCPTLYAEPFGGVNVEAQFSGVPVLSTDWGAFPETVVHGHTGFRCRSIEQFVYAMSQVDSLDSNYIRERAISKWSFEKIGPMFEEYFSMLQMLPKGGFYARNENRKELLWLS